MSFTYAELKQAAQDFLQTSEPTFVANLPLFIRMAEERILKNVQLTLFQRNATGTASTGNQYLACPLDFLAPMALSYTVDGDKTFLEFKDTSFVQSYNPDPADTGPPRYYALYDVSNFLLAKTPDQNYAMELQYLYRPASLTAGAESGTTWLSTNADLSLLYGTLVEAYTFLKGEPDLQQLYMTRFNESLTGLKMLGEAKQTSDQYREGMVRRQKQ